MPLFRHRPLAALCVLFLFGIFVSVITDGAATLFVGALSVFFLLLFLVLKRSKRPRPARHSCAFLSLCALVLLLSQLFSYISYFSPLRRLPIDRGEVSVVAHVDEVTFSEKYATECYVSLSEIDGERAGGRVLLHTDFGVELRRGDELSFVATFLPLSEDEKAYRKEDGCLARANVADTLTILAYAPTVADRVLDALAALRDSLSTHLCENVEGEGGRLMAAMLLGDRAALSDSTQLGFRRLGISHILALSGLHLQILIFLCGALLSRLGIRRRYVLLLLSALLIFYVALTGFSLSVVRAGVMALLVSLSFFVREAPDGLTSLSLSATLICLFSPASVYDVGFLLSCFATLGILTAAELRGKRTLTKRSLPRRILGKAGGALLITLSATLATLPITALYFGEISLLCLPANLLLTPLFSFYLACAPFALLFAPIPFVGTAFSLLGNWMLAPVRFFSNLPRLMLDIAYADLLVIVFLGGALFFLLLLLSRSRRTLALAGGAILSLLVISLSVHTILLSHGAAVHYLAVEQNEYLLVTDGGSGLLYDASIGTSRAGKSAKDLVRSAHLCELDGYLLSHYHARHPATLEALFKDVKVHRLYLPVPTSQAEEDIYRTIVALAEEMQIPVQIYAPKDRLTLGQTTITPFKAEGTVHPTLALSIGRGERMLTYIVADENALCAPAVAKSQHLIFGAHGPKPNKYLPYTQFSGNLLSVIAPEAEEHLHPTLLSHLREKGLLLFDKGPLLIFLS